MLASCNYVDMIPENGKVEAFQQIDTWFMAILHLSKVAFTFLKETIQYLCEVTSTLLKDDKKDMSLLLPIVASS